ncbi:camphor resistance protein CrcB [Nostoc piscinale CENA21]|uniref:Fluoride-specific ion channel FluC n=1 Tax=Nostoc piscinale CENA21 TaxID=224013 RepID=A0A0M4TUG8_9NOSO|nr:fluoride efflux transporter CrcB [Nostoc piscinale]ALF53269.1 camphor resistance protein CrcB [Nostoc piscinale CENA21]
MLQNLVLRNSLGISLGAIAGALSRYYLGLWFTQLFGQAFPYSTLIINVSGCFLMGLFTMLVLGRLIVISPEIRLVVTTGFLGAYTTFSTYELDVVKLLEKQSLEMSLIYWLISPVLSLLGLLLGNKIAEFMQGKKEL